MSTLSDDYCDQYIIHAQDVESRLNITKAPGPDFVPSWILRDFSPLLAQPLAAIYNASVREGIVPHIWKSAIVVPVPKVHPPKSISWDLRPISLLPVLAKVLESFVADWLHDILTPVLDPNQFGNIKRPIHGPCFGFHPPLMVPNPRSERLCPCVVRRL